MFRIRRVYESVLPVDQAAIAAVQAILRQRFPGARAADIDELPAKISNPANGRFRFMLFVAERAHHEVKGFALLSHHQRLNFSFLDYIATDEKRAISGGVGGALYERIREEAQLMGSLGIFFECLPDEPDECLSHEILRANQARMRFYERYGARPIAGTGYRAPVKAGDRGLPFLMFDGLDRREPLHRDLARKAVRAILENKYGWLCPPEYVDRVVASFRDDPVRLRPARYVSPAAVRPEVPDRCRSGVITLVVNDKHDIHHVRDRGYVEAPVRIPAILRQIEPTGLFRTVPPQSYSESLIRAVHDSGFVDYLKRACNRLPGGKSVYPYVFPIRNAARPPRELSVRAGYYCIDTFTPLDRNAWLAAKRAVDCTLTAADAILHGERLAYALVRPPGHHAERSVFGGFCYFCNAAIAAQYFSAHGRVAILDVDYHHGNGQQTIFYERCDVLTISIHAHPAIAYPYFSGFADERGEGEGRGFNINYPLFMRVDGARYRRTLSRALKAIARFDPAFLIVSLGLDPAKGDPTGSWLLASADFHENGRMIGSLQRPTLVVQEGGYKTRTLGINARCFFEGLASTALRTRPSGRQARPQRTATSRQEPKQ